MGMEKQRGWGGVTCLESVPPSLTFLEIFLHLRQEREADGP